LLLLLFSVLRIQILFMQHQLQTTAPFCMLNSLCVSFNNIQSLSLFQWLPIANLYQLIGVCVWISRENIHRIVVVFNQIIPKHAFLHSFESRFYLKCPFLFDMGHEQNGRSLAFSNPICSALIRANNKLNWFFSHIYLFS